MLSRRFQIAAAVLIAAAITLAWKPVFAPSILEFRLSFVPADHFTVYINTGKGYREKETRSVSSSGSASPKSLHFLLPAARIRSLRFDPGTQAGLIDIQQLCLRSWRASTCWDADDLHSMVTPITDIAAHSVEGTTFRVNTIGADPALDLGQEVIAAHMTQNRIPSILAFGLLLALLLACRFLAVPIFQLAERSSDIRPRDICGETGFAILLTVGFLLTTGYTAIHHEMWRDELHTWIVGRESHSLLEIYQNTRYDGHGLLWYFLVWPLTRFTENPAAIQVFHLMLATATAYIIARFSPFSRVQKILIVLGYLFVYEYAIIARNYAIGALFLVTFCAVVSQRPRAYLWIGVILALMANTSAHALILSVALAIGYGVYLWRDGFPSGASAKLLAVAAAIFLLGVGTQIFTALPPADLGLDYADKSSTLEWSRILRVFALFESALLAKRPDLGISLWSLLVLIFLIRWLRQPAVMLFFLSASGALAILFYFVYFGSPRHHGFIFLALLAGLWLSAYQTPLPVGRFSSALDKSWQKISNITFSVILGFHVYSGYLSTTQDIRRVVSNGKVTAHYLKAQNLHEFPIVAFADWPTTTVLGYLPRGTQFYHPQGRRWASHVVQDSSRLNWPSQEEVIDEASSLSGERIILLMNVPISDKLVHQKGLRPLAEFTGAGIASENFYIYSIDKSL